MTIYIVRHMGCQVWMEWKGFGGRTCGGLFPLCLGPCNHPGHNSAPLGGQRGAGEPIVNLVHFDEPDLRLSGGHIPGGDTNKSP